MATFIESLQSSCKSTTGGIFGGAAAITNKSGDILLKTAAGRVHWSDDDDAKLDTPMWAFSFTKLLTTIAALQCVEAGLVQLDQPVDTVLPELRDPQVISAGDSETGTKFTLTKARNRITLRHLLTHTSGVGYDALSPLLMAWRESRGEPGLAMCGDVIKAYSQPLLFEPGTSWSYGGGVDWAGVLVERITSRNSSLGAYMQERIFSVLGMRDTSFSLEERPDLKPRIMDLAVRNPDDGTIAPMDHMYPDNAVTHSGGMGIITTVADYVLVVADLINDSPRLLKSETIVEMFKPQFEHTGKVAEGLMAMGSMHESLTGGEKSLGALSFGMGGLVTVKDTPNLPAGTLSWNGMPNLAWFAHKEKGIAGCYGGQMMPPSDGPSEALWAHFTREAWALKTWA